MKISYKYIRKGILISAIFMLVMGIIRNETRDVINKSIQICYECIGIG